MGSAIEKHLRSFKAKIRSITGHQFWLRYSTLAAYRAVCAAIASISGVTRSGAAHADRTEREAFDYITSVFSKYKAAAAVSNFYGQVAEIGPGDSCGVGLMFLGDGCDQVDLVDRFFSNRDEQQQKKINQFIVQQFPHLVQLMKNQDFSERSFRKLTRYYGPSAAAETFFTARRKYDFIVSCAVMEHVYDPVRSISSAISALNPGGMMLHQVDCRDHGQFSGHFHELKFLELPGRMYSPLGWGGGPNRLRLSAYVKAVQQQGAICSIYPTTLAGVVEEICPYTSLEGIPQPVLHTSRRFVSAVRDALARPFREMADEDLMVTSFMLVAKKP